MAHNLATHQDANGIKRHSFYSLRKAGWHSLGQVVDLPLSDPGILNAAGLNWTADKVGLYRSDMVPLKDNFAIVRSDNKETLGIVGKPYQPLQNEALFQFFRNVGGASDYTVETAGALGNGSTVWALARIPDMELAKGEDFSQGYLLIRNSHDGSSTVTITPTMIRVVCQNTLRMAEGEALQRRRDHGRNTLAGGYRVRHTSGMLDALSDISKAYEQTRRNYLATRQAFDALTSAPLSENAFLAMMTAAFGKSTAGETDRAKAIAQNRSDKVRSILASGTCNVTGTAGTLWAGLNAITEYIDHERTTRGSDGDSDAEQRFASACFGGSGDKAKEAAWSAALALV